MLTSSRELDRNAKLCQNFTSVGNTWILQSRPISLFPD